MKNQLLISLILVAFIDLPGFTMILPGFANLLTRLVVTD